MDELEAYLAQHTAAAREADVWGTPAAPLRLEVVTYLTRRPAPLAWVTSVRAVVLREAQVLLVRDPERAHILPGGRREANETLEQTLRREVLEETGWEIAPPRLLGVRHCHHLSPRPAGYAYPYPDFLQVIYAAEAALHVPAARHVDDYELSAEFVPITPALRAALLLSEQALLAGALKQ